MIFRDFEADEIEEVRARGAASAKRVDETTETLRAIMGQFDQIELLSRLAFQMIAGVQAFGTKDYDPPIHSHELELLQALALSHPRSTHLDHRAMADAVDRLLNVARKNSQAFSERSLLRLTTDPQRNRIEAIVERIRATTHTVRGPRHAFQTRAYLRDLAAAMDERFLESLGFTVSDLVEFVEGFGFRAGELLTDLRERSRRWLQCDDARCLELFLADNPGLREHRLARWLGEAPRPVSEVRGALFVIFEEQLRSIFRLDWRGGCARLESLKHHLCKASMGFGDVADDEIRDLHLGNPVRTKPIVAAGDNEHYLFCTQSIFANLVELVDDIAEAGDPALRDACGTFKAGWLEAKLDNLVRKAFPGSHVFQNAKWHDRQGKEGETDCIVALDKTVVLFEAKSGRITPPARRGAEGRLKREIEALLVKPSRQSGRFAELLRSTPDPIAFTAKEGRATINGSDIREIIRFNILFDTLGPLTAGTKRLVDAGFIGASEPMAPSMSIFELETLFDLLPDQISRLHYMRRRGEMELTTLFEADEMDLIAFYLETSFCLSKMEIGADSGFCIYGWSDRIAQLYDHEGRRKSHAVKLKRTPFWEQLQSVIERRRQPGWTRIGFRLSLVGYSDQWVIQRQHEAISKRARRVKKGQAVNSGVYDADGGKTIVIGLCGGKSVSAFGVEQHSRTAAIEIMNRAGCDEALVLYWDIEDRAGTWRFIATFRREDHGFDLGVLAQIGGGAAR